MKKILAVLLSMVMAGILSGCGSTDSESSTQETAATTTAKTEPIEEETVTDQKAERIYNAFYNVLSEVVHTKNFVYYEMTDISSTDQSSYILRLLVEDIADEIDKGYIYTYFVEMNDEIQSIGVCYAESKDSTELEFYPQNFKETWSKEGRTFSELCTALDSVGGEAKDLVDEIKKTEAATKKAEELIKKTGTDDVTLQGVLQSSPDFYMGITFDGMVYYFGYDLENVIDKNKFLDFHKVDQCDYGDLGYCLSVKYPDGVWQKSDDPNYTYMYKSDSFRKAWGDNFYVAVSSSGAYYTSIAFSERENFKMISFSGLMSYGSY